jgi:hypothetical protein
MSISIKPSVANQVRALKAASPFLTEADIVKLTGFDRTQVKNALARKVKMRPKPKKMAAKLDVR